MEHVVPVVSSIDLADAVLDAELLPNTASHCASPGGMRKRGLVPGFVSGAQTLSARMLGKASGRSTGSQDPTLPPSPPETPGGVPDPAEPAAATIVLAGDVPPATPAAAGAAAPAAGAPGEAPPAGAPGAAPAAATPAEPSFLPALESAEPSTDATGKPVVFARKAKELIKVPEPGMSTPAPRPIASFFSRSSLHHVDGTANELRTAASRIKHAMNPTDGPALTALASAKKAGVFSTRSGEEEGHHRSAAAHVVTMVDGDELGADDLLHKAGRTIGHTLLYMGQVSLVYFCATATNMLALVALWVLKDPELLGASERRLAEAADAAAAGADAAASAANAATAADATAQPGRQLWFLSQALEFVPGNKPEADLIADCVDAAAIAGTDQAYMLYERDYFNVAVTLVILSLVVTTLASVASSGFHTLSMCQRFIFLLLTPFGLQTLFVSVLYASALKAADHRDDVAVANKRYDLIVMCQMLRATFETIPLLLVSAATLGVSGHPRVIFASVLMAAISLCYALYGYAVEIASKKLTLHAQGRLQLFLCITASTFWECAALTLLLASVAIGGVRWLVVPLLISLGFVQLLPGVLASSSLDSSKWVGIGLSLLAMTPLAILAGFIDGPLIGFASEHTNDGGFAVSVLDFAVAWRRRVILFVAGLAPIVLDLAGGVGMFSGSAHLADLGEDLRALEHDVILLSEDLGHASLWWWAKALLMAALFIGDLLASSRAWRLAGFTPLDQPDLLMRLQSTYAWCAAQAYALAGFPAGRRYASLAPELEPLTLQPYTTRSAYVKAPPNALISEEQQRLHDSLEDLHRHAQEVYYSLKGKVWAPPAEAGAVAVAAPKAVTPKPEAPVKPADDTDDDELAIYYARMAAFETELAAYEATIALEQAEEAEKEAARLAAEAEAVAAKAAKEADDFLLPKEKKKRQEAPQEALTFDDLKPSTTDRAAMAELVAAETATVLGNLLHLTPQECSVAEAALAKYTPDIEDDAEEAAAQQALLTMLRQLSIPSLQRRVLQEEVALRIAANGGEGAHPFRAVPLSVALTANGLWARGKQRVVGSTLAYDLSEAAVSASHFISHNWADPGGRKVALLREFLCLQPLLVSLFVSTPLFCLLLMPLGMAVHAALPAVGLPWWGFAAVPFTCLILVLTWVAASEAAILPVWLAPWAVQEEAIWIENACVDDAKLNAMMRSGYNSYLDRCDQMVAFVSPAYFERLWCVYELAYFSKKYQGPLKRYLDQDLLLLSVEWPSYLNFCQSSELTPNEFEPLQMFRCRDARCNRPTDRALLLAAIRREWGSEDAFDTYVRTELPPLLARQKQRYGKMLGVLTRTHLDIAFGD